MCMRCVQWNVPVHEWCHRHIYTETMHYAGVSGCFFITMYVR